VYSAGEPVSAVWKGWFEPWQLGRLEVAVPACREGRDDRWKVLLRRDLEVELTAQREHRAGDPREGASRVVMHEPAKPWRRDQRRLGSDLSQELIGVSPGGRGDRRLGGVDQLPDLRLCSRVV
jgi:hypothetical protein